MSSLRVKNIEKTVLSDNYYTLFKFNFDYQKSDGSWVKPMREVYERGHGAGILLYNTKKQTVILIKQFRFPTFVHDNEDGFLVEIPAGLLDQDNPEQCIIRETEEEVGIRLKSVKKVYEGYSSPGVLTEKMHFFVAEYSDDMKVSEGGGIASENEDIEVLEIPFTEAIDMLNSGKIEDTRTIVLLQYAQIHNLLN
ncbi:NUDIX domain-containing protein [Polaribacter sp. KT 15]|uniref:NUDIX domain-containing protein n=1 Tax=Polaribacter sp. KT 15 TaxID=1896175 RepID=UPI00090B7D9A|nr:NUDIX domain-containing protein [Polaribacter sp. KT 15]SHN02519.1 nudix-type nucleoside diphosphatase, YffH/AdpP family [Polaribacter sp. KT 15]